MEPLPPAQKPPEQPEVKIDRARQILMWVFVICFWLFFYWYKDRPPPEKSEMPKLEQNSPSPGKNNMGNRSDKQ